MVVALEEGLHGGGTEGGAAWPARALELSAGLFVLSDLYIHMLAVCLCYFPWYPRH